MKLFWLAFAPALLAAQIHRAEQDLEIHYWLLDPDTHQFRISHDFTVSKPGQKYVHSFVRKGSVVTKSIVIDLNTGKQLETYTVTGKSVNALGYYPHPTDPDSVVVQGDLDHALAEGESVRVRVIETYHRSCRIQRQGRRTGVGPHVRAPLRRRSVAPWMDADIGERAGDNFVGR
jgi:hypothetical protein